MRHINWNNKLKWKAAAGSILAILAVIMCLAGCVNASAGSNANGSTANSNTAASSNKATNQTTTQPATTQKATNKATTQTTTTPTTPKKQDLGRLCLYRQVKDAQYDADMEIVEGRINALTDGNYLKEETILQTLGDDASAVDFYVPKELYGENSLRDVSRELISRPMNLWLSNDSSDNSYTGFYEKIELPRDAFASIELLYGCPEPVNPFDLGMELEEFNYLKITLTEEYSRQNPQIWEWQRPAILQDVGDYSEYAYHRVVMDQEERCIYLTEDAGQENYCKGLLYSYTHEPLSGAFYILTYPVVEWETGDEIKGARQIEAGEFEVETMVIAYSPTEAYVSKANWEQTLQAIRERMDASGVPYALGSLPDQDRSVVIRMEDGLFAQRFVDYAVMNIDISLHAFGEEIDEDLSVVKVSVGSKDSKKVLSLDMSALKKDTLNRLSSLCEKAGRGRIILDVNDTAIAYGYCDKTISDGTFIMDYNALTGEHGFEDQMEWLPEFLEALINGTPFPMVTSYTQAVTLQSTEQTYLTKEGQLWIPGSYNIDREELYAGIREKLGDLEYKELGVLTTGTPCLQFAMPAGEMKNAQIAETMSRTFRALSDDIFTYWMRIDFLGENGKPSLQFITNKPINGDKKRFKFSMYYGYDDSFTETDEAEIRKALAEDPTLANLVNTDK